MKTETMIFFRNIDGKDGFYDVEFEMPEDGTMQEAAREHAKANPGTIRVEDINGNVLWPLH